MFLRHAGLGKVRKKHLCLSASHRLILLTQPPRHETHQPHPAINSRSTSSNGRRENQSTCFNEKKQIN
ncbi:hypothetical protein ASB62_02400 [Chlorobium limicola]|uniref:Uncharacterized protein n=1 Tax=Chlorobium limicola TaxID=1092 RepID=A0A117MRH2_CHLLI|nr:hypothetical protein ASB62_02400 [Chlorobium limicola]